MLRFSRFAGLGDVRLKAPPPGGDTWTEPSATTVALRTYGPPVGAAIVGAVAGALLWPSKRLAGAALGAGVSAGLTVGAGALMKQLRAGTTTTTARPPSAPPGGRPPVAG
jgi:hypothetical protein